MNNATLLAADPTTHVKIVLMALVASIAVSLVGIAVHAKPMGSEPLLRTTIGIVKAGETPPIRIPPTRTASELESSLRSTCAIRGHSNVDPSLCGSCFVS
jgi:hypothetical protein